MLLGGDELGRTQQGNNNVYCQDNELAWYNWSKVDENLLSFVRQLIQFCTRHPVFRRRRWFQGRPIHGRGVADITWFTTDGEPMADEHWGEDSAKALCVFLNGEAIPSPDELGNRIRDDSFCLLLNAHHEPRTFRLPGPDWGGRWTKVLDTAGGLVGQDRETVDAGAEVPLEARSLAVFRRTA